MNERRATLHGAAAQALALALALAVGLLIAAMWWLDPFAAVDGHGVAGSALGDGAASSATAEPASHTASPSDDGATPTSRDDAGVAAGWLLAVRVVDGFGDAVEGAAIEVTTASGAPLLHGRSNTAGVWQERLKVDACLVRAEHPAFGRSILWRAHVDAAPGPVVLCLLQPALVQGRLLGPDGNPIVDASISVRAQWTLGETEPGLLCPASVPTDAHGAFAFEAVSGAHLTLRHVLGANTCVAGCVAVAGAKVLLAHPGAFAITVDVFDEQGQPIAQFPGDGGESVRQVSVLLPEVTADRGSPELSRSLGDHTAIAELVALRHRFHRLHTVFREPGEHRVSVSAVGFAPRQVTAVLHAEAPRCVTSVVLPRGIATRGIVVMENGRPAAWRHVQAEERGSGLSVSAVSAADGSFELMLPPEGTWQPCLILYEADANDARTIEGPACRPGETGLRIVVKDMPIPDADRSPRLEPAGVLDLEVLRSDGRPAPFPVLQWRGLGRHGRDARNVEARVDQHRYGIELAHTPGPPARLSIEDAISKETAWLDLPLPPGSRTVRTQPRLPFAVRVRRGAAPMRGISVELLPCGEATKERVDAAGVARFAAVPQGPLTVRVVRGFEELATGTFELSVDGPNEFTIDVAR